SKPGLLAPAAIREVRALFERLGRDETVAQLAEILEEMPERLGEDAVVRLLGYFPPRSIGAFMSAADRVQRPEVKRAFASCVQRLAETNREAVVQLLESDDPAVLVGSLRWIGRLEVGSALGQVVPFLRHRDPEVRVAAVEALVSLRAAAAADGLIPLLEDADRNVRIAAARALGTLTYVPARAALENALSEKRLRDADRNEKVAFFDAFGRLAGPDGVPILDRILNTRSWLGRSESADIRASAALALARIKHPSARDALDSASNDSDPVVRSAVTRALRGEAAS
ncbi:MAG: HEAT repeat domain-containing protein, partial [Gemmatimonadota bacterium]